MQSQPQILSFWICRVSSSENLASQLLQRGQTVFTLKFTQVKLEKPSTAHPIDILMKRKTLIRAQPVKCMNLQERRTTRDHTCQGIYLCLHEVQVERILWSRVFKSKHSYTAARMRSPCWSHCSWILSQNNREGSREQLNISRYSRHALLY